MRVDGLEETEDDPNVDGDDVQVAAEGAVEDGACNRAGTENHDLSGVRVLGGETEGRGVLVVDLVDVLVQRAPVESAVGEEVEHILEDEEDGDLHSLLLPRREGHLPGRHAEVLSHRVEEPDLRGLCEREYV